MKRCFTSITNQKKGCLAMLSVVIMLLASRPVLPSEPSFPFTTAKVRFEQNVSDQDVEVVFEVNAGDKGLSKLTVLSPDGRAVIDSLASDYSTLGIREYNFESPEPRDVLRLKAVYPQGEYIFSGTTVSGDKYRSASRLSHELPPAISFLRPAAGARGVAVKDLEIAWTPVKDVAAYILEIQHDKLGVELKVKLPASTATFAVPNGLLLPGEAYQLSIGTVSDEGNISFLETTFTTVGTLASARP